MALEAMHLWWPRLSWPHILVYYTIVCKGHYQYVQQPLQNHCTDATVVTALRITTSA